MKTFILLSFFFLGFAFYAMSGGPSFDPEETREARIAARLAEAPQPESPEPEKAPATDNAVTRVALSLATIDDVLGERSEPAPAAAEPPAASVQTSLEATDLSNVPVARITSDNQIILPSIIFPGATTAATSASAIGSTDVRSVTRTNVNVRGGPGTEYGVVTQLTQGDKVEVLDDPGNGWVQLRPLNGGPVGWMADFLLTRG